MAVLGQAVEPGVGKTAVRPFLGRTHIARERLGRAKGPSDRGASALLKKTQRICWLDRAKRREGSIGTGCHLLPRQHRGSVV
jgi:hypothetical protein